MLRLRWSVSKMGIKNKFGRRSRRDSEALEEDVEFHHGLSSTNATVVQRPVLILAGDGTRWTRGKTLSSPWNLIIRPVNSRPTFSPRITRPRITSAVLPPPPHLRRFLLHPALRSKSSYFSFISFLFLFPFARSTGWSSLQQRRRQQWRESAVHVGALFGVYFHVSLLFSVRQ